MYSISCWLGGELSQSLHLKVQGAATNGERGATPTRYRTPYTTAAYGGPTTETGT